MIGRGIVLLMSCTDDDHEERENKTQTFCTACLGGGSDVVSVICFGVRVSVMFHFMFVHYTLSSVWVAEWPPFGK